MSDDVLVKVDNVSKRFCRSLKRSLWYGLQDLGSEIGGRRHGGGSGLPQSSADVQLRPDEFWAVKDVSFELRRGECLGLIGRNGAGKTTLLRMLNGLIKPDTGQITINGRIGALIALGAGFNPILTGKENIYTSAAVLGFSSRETALLIDKIVDFAEIGDFIDSPVQSYSSGMQVRLGFAAAIFMKASIILLDEVLAVGDANFRSKCYSELNRIKKEEGSFILVTHSEIAMKTIATKALYLRSADKPNIIGDPNKVYEKYNQDSGLRKQSITDLPCLIADGIWLSDIKSSGTENATPAPMDDIVLNLLIDYKYKLDDIRHCQIDIHSCNYENSIIWSSVTPLEISSNIQINETCKDHKTTMCIKLEKVPLNSGFYEIKLHFFGETFLESIAITDLIPLEIRSSIAESQSRHIGLIVMEATAAYAAQPIS
jgi:ABC-type polysaccharide/polyol phosphate transport system ATPase subunit